MGTRLSCCVCGGGVQGGSRGVWGGIGVCGCWCVGVWGDGQEAGSVSSSRRSGVMVGTRLSRVWRGVWV